MKTGNLLLTLVAVVLLAVVIVDRTYVAKFEGRFKELEKQRIVISNKLATAKIVSENLNHVRDLVFKNMDFPGQEDTISHETHFFEYVTECVNDLKLKLVSVKPARPVVQDRITTYAYDIEMEGDFFKFGELCAKFENSRRIISVESFDVGLMSERQARNAGSGNKGIKITMRVHTYRVRKVESLPEIQPVG